ncbi:LDLR chaperone boca [Octopus bimaculoides]|uniref:LDLR chaperone MESD n=1 Tax=Octopus bimaculoides TaxID=37653 RepID=A0A0L8GTN4_OCTBM|nr:LDLR chaperone boca [Octopus bimaculoides]|eukprot:XP_014778382.1 PREDICTED: LDLR chaperone boca-like [Octopus bimaculoides]
MSKIVCFYVLCLFSLLHNVAVTAEKSKLKSSNPDSADSWKKKDIRDYSEADLERLYEQWEEGDEELEPDELPEWKREAPAVDFSKYDSGNPEELLMMSKKGKTLMMFVSVSGDPPRHETEEITSLWQSSLYNANIDITRYLISDNRAIFMLKDGSKAWEIKNFLVQQERCLSVTIENQDFPGKGSPKKTEL